MVGFESVAIVLTIITLLYFVINRLLLRIKSFKTNKLKRLFLSIFLSVFSYIIISFFFIKSLTSIPQEPFNESTWKNNVRERHKMIDDLLDSDYLIGKNKAKIIDIFGNPKEYDSVQNIMFYELYKRSWADIYIVDLKLFLENNSVVKFEFKE